MATRDLAGLERLLDGARNVPLVPRYRAVADAYDAVILLSRGDAEGAGALARRALASLDSVRGMVVDLYLSGYVAVADTLLAVDPEAGRSLLSKHREHLRSIAARIRDDAMRDAFLHVERTHHGAREPAPLRGNDVLADACVS